MFPKFPEGQLLKADLRVGWGPDAGKKLTDVRVAYLTNGLYARYLAIDPNHQQRFYTEDEVLAATPLYLLDLHPDDVAAIVDILGPTKSLPVASLRDQLASQLPPVLEEPDGDHAVVEDVSGVLWTKHSVTARYRDNTWRSSDGTWKQWGSIKAVKIHFEGVIR